MNALLALSLSIGGIFSLLAGVMAFLITYNEYDHHYEDKRIVVRISLKMGLFAFIVFLALAVGSSLVLIYIV